jgi:uncharacterized protein (DUF433 family)
MKAEIAIVDRGRGPQLSTTRVTVQDLLPYFQEGCSYEEIRRWIPGLSVEEIQVAQRYIAEHWEEVLEQDRRIRERNANRKTSPESERILQEGNAKMLALKEQWLRSKDNGEAR